VNGDSKPDIVVANCGTTYCPGAEGSVAVLLGNGDGAFRPAVTYGSGWWTAVSVTIADVNGDGKPDIVVLNAGNYTAGVLLGNVDGTFQPVVLYGIGGEQPRSIAVADVNDDGKPDVLVSLCSVQYCGEDLNGAVGVLLNNTPTCTTPPVITISTTPKSLWPPNGGTAPVTISGTITDPDAACSITSAAYLVRDEYGKVQPSGTLALGPGGAFSFIVPLQASRLGSDLDGRLYTITVGASNNVGMTGSQSGTVVVPHDLGH
jgi:hypothetical protein